MRIRLDQVRFEPFHWQETCNFSPEALGHPELVKLGPVTWRGQVNFADPGFYFRARMTYEQTLVCDRCLKQVTEPVTGDIQLLVYTDAAEHGPGDHELHEKDMTVLHVPEEVLETEPLLLEQLQLNIPMKPLCRPDCAGLCPVCGADLNSGPCDCPPPSPDPRWTGLAAIRDRLNERELRCRIPNDATPRPAATSAEPTTL